MKSITWLLLAASTAAASAGAQVAVAEDGRQVTCRAPAGHWDSRRLTSLASGGRMAGSVRLVEAAPHARHVPAAGFLLALPNGRERAAGVQIAMRPREEGVVDVGVRLPGQRELVRLAQAQPGAWVPVAARIDEGGTLEVRIGETVVRHRVGARQARVPMLMCSSGTFEFLLDEGMQVSERRFPWARD